MSFCGNCGKPKNREDVFCTECGAKVNTVANRSENDDKKVVTKKEVVQDGTAKNPRKKALMSAVVLVLIAALTFGGMTLWNMFNEKNENFDIDTIIAVGNNIDFGGIQWRVLDERDGQVLLLSEYVLEHRYYHHTWHDGAYWPLDITWANSDIRAWLNGEFYNRFTAEERSRIANTAVTTNPNPWFGTPGGGTTTDKIFLLSLEEVVRYFGDSGELARPRTSETHVQWWGFNDQFDENRRARNIYGGYTWWWLRSPGYYSNSAADVYNAGYVLVYGNHVDHPTGVRPALWLNL